jgi:hypothetical protein
VVHLEGGVLAKKTNLILLVTCAPHADALKRGQKRWLKAVVGRERRKKGGIECCYLKYEGEIMSASPKGRGIEELRGVEKER